MLQAIKPELEVIPKYRNDKGVFDMETISSAMKSAPDVISKALIWAAGKYFGEEDYAITKLTEGVGHVEYISDYEYNYPIMSGDLDPMAKIAIAPSTTTNLGLAGQRFVLTFRERVLKFQNTCIAPSGLQCRVVKTPEVDGSGKYWDYELEIMGNDRTAALASSDVIVGAEWERGPSPVELEDSIGVESEEVYPGEAKNMISVLRASMKWAGHVARYPIHGLQKPYDGVQINIPVKNEDGSKSIYKYWWDWKEWQFYLKLRKYKEIDHWISEYNKLPDGTIAQKGPSGKPIPRGDGILNSIPNRSTYPGVLSGNRFKNLTRELFYGMSNADNRHIQLHTGTGGMEVVNNALLRELKDVYTMERTMNTFVTREGETLSLGRYFTTYKTVDGHTITVHRNPVFDLIYKNSPKFNNLPSFSYELVYLDMSTYNGVPNMKMFTRAGREMVKKHIVGMATPPEGYPNSDFASSDRDNASVEYLYEQGVNFFDTSCSFRVSLV